jgi:hypothetical protein
MNIYDVHDEETGRLRYQVSFTTAGETPHTIVMMRFDESAAAIHPNDIFTLQEARELRDALALAVREAEEADI